MYLTQSVNIMIVYPQLQHITFGRYPVLREPVKVGMFLFSLFLNLQPFGCKIEFPDDDLKRCGSLYRSYRLLLAEPRGDDPASSYYRLGSIITIQAYI